MNRGTLFVFVKAPRAGAVKTRLGREIGMGRAAALCRIMTAQTISEAAKGDWRLHIAVGSPSALTGWSTTWPPRLKRIAQGGGNLGARMKRVFFKAPSGPVVIIGADSPGLRAVHLRQAFNYLRSSDAVFGPAADGGFWLIGLARRRGAPGLFDNVRWSSHHALADTLAALPSAFQIEQLQVLHDVDVAADLGELGPRSAAHHVFADSSSP